MTESRPGDIFKPGDLLNNTYRIEAVLGRGGTSEVYKARNEISNRFVAIKALKSEFSGDEGYLTLMRREEEIREIRHDAVVRYSENHRTPDGHIYLVMDYVDGPGLDAILKQGGMAAPELVAVCRRVAEGLRVAHARRIVHRDLSPDNIILRGGVPEEAVIIDFGIAKDTNPGAETIVGNEFAGKYAYAAPEQLAGNTDARSDIYALGALLLATYRGARPDIGANPMEVLKRKAVALDTGGVPEPLKGLIDRMTRPEPSERFQSADALLAAIDGSDLGERTVIVPRAKALPASPPVSPTPSPLGSAQNAGPQTAAGRGKTGAASGAASGARGPAKPGGRGGMIAAGLLCVVVLAGSGAWFGGLLDPLFGPGLPVADPFSLIVERPSTGAARAVGYVPSAGDAGRLTELMAGIGGTAELTVATGVIPATWSADVLTVVAALAVVDTWRLAVNGADAQVTGITADRAVRDALMAKFGGGLPGGLKGSAIIQLGPLFLSAEVLVPLLKSAEDCGPLTLLAPPATGYGTDATITVTGRMADAGAQVGLEDAIRAVAGDRRLAMQVELLNPALCEVEATLPNAPAGGFHFNFGFGDRPDVNPTGRYLVGENPVIDLLIPAEVSDGYISVSVIDVSGNVYHLLPNLNRPANDVAALRGGAAGAFKVRIAYPASENADPSRIAFLVDASSLGKSKVLVIHSAAPLFDELRPTTESVGGYAAALRQRAESGAARIFSIDSAILTSAAP